MARFSVVVPAYNASATLAETLDAMLAQQHTDWECVIVDDGSSDDTPDIAAAYAGRDLRFRLIRQSNAGTAEAYRTGIHAASADLLVICAADDMLLPEHLLAMDELITRRPEYDIYSSNGMYLHHDTGDRAVVYAGEEWSSERSMSFEEVIALCFFSVGAVFRRAIYDVAGGHRAGVYVDDYDFWLRAMARGARHLYTPLVLAAHRVSGFQQTAKLTRVFESNIEVYQHLLTDPALDPRYRAPVRLAIEDQRELIERLVVVPELQRQASVLRHVVERRVGSRLAGPVLAAIHSVSWITRPARRALARKRMR